MNERSMMSTIHTNDSSHSAADAGSPVYCVIGNIPAELHSADLRSFFSQMTEIDGFHCFHYRHRPEVNPTSTAGAAPSSPPPPAAPPAAPPPAAAAPPAAPPAAAAAAAAAAPPPPTCCCVVSVRRSHLVELLRNYDKKLWVTRAGKYLRASRVHISQLRTGPEGASGRSSGPERPATATDEQPPPPSGAACDGVRSGVPRGPIRTAGQPSSSLAATSSSASVEGTATSSLSASQRHRRCDGAAGGRGPPPAARESAGDRVPSRPAASRSRSRPSSPQAAPDGAPSASSSSRSNGGCRGNDVADGSQQPATSAAAAVSHDDDDSGGDTLDLQQLLKLPELRPPAVLPHGNVGTSNGVLLDLIAQCKIPARLISKLGLEFPKAKRPHRYSSVQFQYEARRGSGRGARGKRPRPSAAASLGGRSSEAARDQPPCAPDAGVAAAGCAASRDDDVVWCTGDGHRIRDDDPDVAMATRAETDGDVVITGATPAAGAGDPVASDREEEEEEEEEEFGEEDDHDAEEWDRHEALHDDVDKQGRTEERLFENEIELKWEKGGSGLVFYTDAAYWDDMKGEEDERLADEYDVDYSVFYDPSSGTKDAMDVMDMEMETQRRAGKDVVDWRTKGGFEKFTKGFGGRVLRDQGWKSGAGLGRAEQGIADPVEADGQPAYDKRGLGYFGEKLRRDVSGAQRPQRHVTSKYDPPDYGDTMLRTRGPLAQKRRRRADYSGSGGGGGGGFGRRPPVKEDVNEEGNVAKVDN